jgi:MOSC domain-containing protein YiiM
LVLVGEVLEMFISTKDGRVNKNKLDLDAKGVLEDKYYNKDIQRSVLIASTHSYDLARSQGVEAPFSALGENLLISYNPYHLKKGEKLHVGTVILEISQHCTLCKSLAKVESSLPKLLKDDRGIFAKVIQDGVISKGDNIYLLNNEEN